MKQVSRLVLAFILWLFTEYYRTAPLWALILMIDSFVIMAILWAELVVGKTYARKYAGKMGRWFALAYILLVLIPEMLS